MSAILFDAIIFDEIHSYEFYTFFSPKLFDEPCHQIAMLIRYFMSSAYI